MSEDLAELLHPATRVRNDFTNVGRATRIKVTDYGSINVDHLRRIVNYLGDRSRSEMKSLTFSWLSRPISMK
jgi:hypothetical protein